ncbi:YfcL family protein [Marinomonas sp. PE14-40]|uniref:YfcL family protein n=1 Tax=Marinomonas sp. PE14-40 TaxID=3060621 RepID=UPI003F6656B2
MTMSFAQRADQICDQLREIEHTTEDNDTLFFCAYLLGLLGVHGGIDAHGQVEFDENFEAALKDAFANENMSKEDQAQILALWNKVIA